MGELQITAWFRSRPSGPEVVNPSLRRLARSCALVLLCGAASTVPAGVGAQQADLAAEVEARERAFAKTMADRDLEAFLTFISPEAIFFGREGALRGRDEIARAWAPFFEGDSAPFAWEPDLVEVLASGGLALSSGPVVSPTGETVGRFNTIWRLDSDGVWRVVFDKGS